MNQKLEEYINKDWEKLQDIILEIGPQVCGETSGKYRGKKRS